MLLLRRISRLPASIDRGCAVTIGGFDGMHVGHQEVLNRVLTAARERNLASVVFSFEPSPKEFMARGAPPPRLMTLREKCAALNAAGVDAFYCPPFNDAIRTLSPEDFMRKLLAGLLKARHVIQGPDFRFGYRRSGGMDELAAGGRSLGFSVEQAPRVSVDGERVSSTGVRRALAASDLELAARLLGRRYGMGGRVIHGLKIGAAKLGYPTANIALKGRVSPIDGIFAVRVHGVEAEPLAGVASIGYRPTVGGTEKILEAHIFDFNGDLYGRFLDIEPVAKLRDEVHFSNLEELRVQMDRDAVQARELLRAA
ncbi:MAG: bifunctional riboflavin kinase/FAD synthetase [Gammaproteobacteria bacterium]|nr:bifunctional riboflavin kinase/FAD synthetase [Gammaproteobacteria bacterium]MYF59033.1 bifunctional riboflavin kinase/FAD synthetase [Gammaproteobacteria bacterium]